MRASIYNKVEEEKMQQFLDRFMRGDTTLAEERWLACRLKDYRGTKWAAYQEMFAWFEQGMPEKPLPVKHPMVRRLATHWKQIAAAIVVVVGVGWKVTTKPPLGNSNEHFSKMVKETPTRGNAESHNIKEKEFKQQGKQTERTRQMASAGRKNPAYSLERNLPTSTMMTETVPASPILDVLDERRIMAEVLVEQAQERAVLRQELRNNLMETVYTMLPDDNGLIRLVMDETGDYQLMLESSPVEL